MISFQMAKQCRLMMHRSKDDETFREKDVWAHVRMRAPWWYQEQSKKERCEALIYDLFLIASRCSHIFASSRL